MAVNDILYHEDYEWLSTIDCDDDFCCGDCKGCYQKSCEDRIEPYEGDD